MLAGKGRYLALSVATIANRARLCRNHQPPTLSKIGAYRMEGIWFRLARSQPRCDLFLGGLALRTDSNCLAEAGARTAGCNTMPRACTSFLYSVLLASLSARTVEPSSRTPP